MKPIIIAIVGKSGSGKTYMTEFLQSKLNVSAIVSYTTSPMRSGEINGKDHYFISEKQVPHKEHMLVYTRFGEYEYFSLHSQIPNNGICTYVIDEKGLEELTNRFADRYEIISVLLLCPMEKLAIRGIDPKRIKRDRERKRLSTQFFDCIICNDGSIEEFEYRIMCQFNNL